MGKELELKRLAKNKLVAQANIMQGEIRILELHEEIERNQNGMEAQRKLLSEIDIKIKALNEPKKDKTS